ncbi:hypothetical protein C0J52_06581 [Blattella germanica]|nr:hypothetical protein C0J52_06581 [Blattella germanica]
MVKLLALFTTVWALSSVRGVLEDEYQVQDVSSEERVGALIRHGRSRTHFVRYEHRGAPELVYMGPVAYENYDLPDVVSSEKEVDVIPTMSVIEEITSVTEQETTTPTTPAPVIIRHSKPVEHNHLQKYSEQKPKLSSNISEIMEILKKKGKASHEEVPAGKIKGGGEIEDDYFSLPNTDDDDEELVVVEEGQDLDTLDGTPEPKRGNVDIVTRFLTIVESQHLLGENCTAGTDLNLGEGVVDRYAQERFRVEADVAVNRANMLTRLWKYADSEVMNSEYLLHASVFSMVEFDEDIFAAGNCYDQYQYKDYWLFCPYAYRLPEGPILVKDLAVEYKYLSNTSEWFYIARKHAENVIRNYSQFSRGEYCHSVGLIILKILRRCVWLPLIRWLTDLSIKQISLLKCMSNTSW